MSVSTVSPSVEEFSRLYRSTQPLDRILSFAFGNDQLSTPFSPPTPPQDTAHFLLVSKTFRDHALPFFYHSITILRAQDWITFFEPRKGIFVVGNDVERRKSLVKELRINMQKDTRIPIDLPRGKKDRKEVARLQKSGAKFSTSREDLLVPLVPVVLPNLKHLCLFITKVSRRSKDTYVSGDRQLRAVIAKGVNFEDEVDADDDGSIASDGSFQMDKDILKNLNFERTAFLREILPPFQRHYSHLVSQLAPASDAPRLETIRRVGFEQGNAAKRIEETYPFPPGLVIGEPIPRILTVYCFPSGKVNDRALGLDPARSRWDEGRREDLMSFKVLEALPLAKETGLRIELVGFSDGMRRVLVRECQQAKGIECVFWKEKNGSFSPFTSIP